MKNILLSADSEIIVYSVPDEVEENLNEYIDNFYEWMNNGTKETEKFRLHVGFCFTEKDFIDYLNKIFDERSFEVENLGFIEPREIPKEIPEEYKELIYFNF